MKKPTITIFYSLADNKLLKIEEIDSIDKELDSVLRTCLMNGFRVNNYQDRLTWS